MPILIISVGACSDMIGVERFGASAPATVLLREYGVTVDNVCVRVKALLVDAGTKTTAVSLNHTTYAIVHTATCM